MKEEEEHTMENFVSSSPFKTPSMQVTVVNKDKRIVDSYAAPEGFRLDAYVGSLYPKYVISTTFYKNENGKQVFKVQVLSEDDSLVVTHLGVYDASIDD